MAPIKFTKLTYAPGDLRDDYLLYKRDRFIMIEERSLNAIEAAGLQRSERGLTSLFSVKA